MGDTQKSILIDLFIGLVIALAGAILMDVFHAQNLRDVLRLLSDCFFLPAAILLAGSGLACFCCAGCSCSCVLISTGSAVCSFFTDSCTAGGS